MNRSARVSRQGPILRAGYPFIVVALVGASLGFWFHGFVGFGLLVVAGAIALFFRNPRRYHEAKVGEILSPADGRVVGVSECAEDVFLKKPCRKISIFMSALNVHANRMPASGVIQDVRYFPGQFRLAWKGSASLHNERNGVWLRTDTGLDVVFFQVAGWFARRIVCYAKAGEPWQAGDLCGLIRFGSRVDVYIPLVATPLVAVGERVRCGQTVLARLEGV